jgi:mono/diheme cytochrome c family protein
MLMWNLLRRSITTALLLPLFSMSSLFAAAVDYEREVKPIFKEHCSACHGVLKQQAGLRVDTGAGLRAGGVSGAAIVPGKPQESLLLKVVTGRGDFLMPPEGDGAKLSAEKIDLLTRWIAAGANSPADERPDEEPKHYWSYQPVRRPPVPLIEGAVVHNPVDEFLSAEHVKHQLTVRQEADKAILLRRVSLDLIGLPPNRDELHVFLDDERPDAYERIVDRLLASPQYGERWGRHWMDVWRYSDWYGSRGGNEIRYSQRHIWRWRDWIVDSLNANHGYDRMVHEMLAGDELAPGDPQVIRATGFLGRNWYKFDRNVWMFETIEQTSQAFLAATMKCCRCHDHKFDPLVQQDYYRFRAFFEPHDVRTDPLSGDLSTEKDATLGPVLKTGVPLVYDKHLDVKTYVFKRGDNRYPDESQLMNPGVPAVFGIDNPVVTAVDLPQNAWFPSLHPAVIAGLEQSAQVAVERARDDLSQKRQVVVTQQQKLDQLAAGEVTSSRKAGTVFTELFEVWRPEIWKIVSGQWEYQIGKLVQAVPGSFTTITADVIPPQDFSARVRYRTLEAGSIHSVGLFFDMVDAKDAQAIYSATNNTTSTIQAFHRQGGVEQYPSAGIVPWPIQIGQELTVDVATRGQLLNVWVNGELAIVYTMPMPRQPGRIGLWTHAGSAEFLEVLIDRLPVDFPMAAQTADRTRSPYAIETMADIEMSIVRSQGAIRLAEKAVDIAHAEQTSLQKRIAAEREKAVWSTQTPSAIAPANVPLPSAFEAATAERQLAVLKAERDLLQAEQNETSVNAAGDLTGDAKAKAAGDSQAKVAAANKALETARSALTVIDGTYTSLGPMYPTVSTGRRTALARWITDSRNPRTSRVAVNHIWLRHFGEAIVPTVANFGLNGQRPSHPELLDWLGAELTDSGWDMKRLHRLMVNSAAYRRVTTDGPDAKANLAIDPGNRFLWRMNSRRMESEVVRDSVLDLAGRLDVRFGGPEIPETQGEQSTRRSLYFRSTPNEKMSFLEAFDQANPNECYRRQESVMPQQALALMNSFLSLSQARAICDSLEHNQAPAGPTTNLATIIPLAFETVLSRAPTNQEISACERSLGKQKTPNEAIQTLIHVLLNHNDFVTIR